MKIASKSYSKKPDYSQLSQAELVSLLLQKDASLAQRDADIKQRDAYIERLEEIIRLQKVQRFAAKSEKQPFQITLFDEAELESAIDDLIDEIPEDSLSQELAQTKKTRQRQRGFSTSLNRIRREISLSDDDKAGATKTFFTKVKEELEFIPAQLNVIEIWQEKAVFESPTGEHVIAAKRPTHPLGKCIATTSLLAYIITSKYTDGLPLYRLDGMLARLGHEIGRNNMANWIIRLNDVFKPLINLMREQQNLGRYIQADETRIQVLKETGKTAQSDKWMWVTRGGPPDKPSVLFDYDPTRAGHVPTRLLEGFSGVLQVDGYSGYGKVCRELDITRIGCWDHARRKFVEAARGVTSQKGKSNKAKPSKADVGIGKIRKLYAIESKIEGLSESEKYTVRQELALPVLQDFKAWLETNHPKVPKDSLIFKAIQYTLNQWESLVAYCDHGFVHISNALAENAIRPFAVGRRNWLFADSSRGANASATCYSLIETAKANGLEPSSYIHYLLDHIADADTLEKIEALLPWNMPKAS
ncbi:IS66 family transposase [Marinomonas arctica]|uniref:IS66 family transposase n=4 Tax=Marinomonas TaxID=28253 RepID=A0A7H1J915_9GAMM|nr:IS66 family transposase [Marinomonas arctica]QNT04289.1 IS66 family transposase [Marinomonas arctica]QNT06981.1 IS66 family transposase [Marinomonas arctica]